MSDAQKSDLWNPVAVVDITEGEEPATSGRHNLKTLGIAFAAVESSRRGTEVGVEEALEQAGYRQGEAPITT